MIKHSNKKCSVENCEFFRYARDYCLYHYKSLYLYPKQKNKPKLTKKTIKRNIEYHDKREEFIEETKLDNTKGKIFCIFCGKEITGDPSLHHGLGRDDDVMFNTDFWFLSHNYCHVHEYHSMSWIKIPWWPGYIERLKQEPPGVGVTKWT